MPHQIKTTPSAIVLAVIVVACVLVAPRFIDANNEDAAANTALTNALATAIAVNGTAVQAFGTAVPANADAVEAFATAILPTPTATSTPTVTPTPTATPTAEEIELSTPGEVPEHMVYAWCDWDFGNADRDRDSALDEITVDIEIHNDIALTGSHGIYWSTTTILAALRQLLWPLWVRCNCRL